MISVQKLYVIYTQMTLVEHIQLLNKLNIEDIFYEFRPLLVG